jgi:hypothetical protein
MLIHIDRFHTDSSDPLTFFATWSFIGTYVFVPPAVFIGLVHQLRMPGVDPPRKSRLPAWFRITLGVHAATMLIVGAALVVVPATADTVWPWALTELTGRAVGAFGFATGLVAAIALFEDDWERILAAVTIYPVLGVLELIVLVRYHSELNWASPTSWVYLAFLLSVLLAGLAAWFVARRELTARRTPYAAECTFSTGPRND